MRLVSTKYRPEVCDGLFWAALKDGTFLSEEVSDTPENRENVERLLTMESIKTFQGGREKVAEADAIIQDLKRQRAEEVKVVDSESAREVARVAQINHDLVTERNQLRTRVTDLEAEVKKLQEGGAGGMRTQPEGDAALAEDLREAREARDAAIAERDMARTERDAAHTTLDAKDAIIAERDATIQQLQHELDLARAPRVEEKPSEKADEKTGTGSARKK